MMMISVTTCYKDGKAIDSAEFYAIEVACSFIRAMWSSDWADHFVVEGPDWKVIVRRRKHG